MDKVDGALLEVSKAVIPGGATIAALVDLIYPSGDKAWKAAAEREFQDLVLEMERRLEALRVEVESQGKRIDDLSAGLGIKVTDEILRDHAAHADRTKTDAMINAAVRVLDPRWLTPDARRHWYRVLLTLTGSDIEIVRWLVRRGAIDIAADGLTCSLATQMGNPPESAAYVTTILTGLKQRGFAVETSGPEYNPTARRFTLNGATVSLFTIARPIIEPPAS